MLERVYVEITNVCNLKCDFCPGTSREAAFMSVERFAHIASACLPLTERVFLHVMGEPLLHPDFSRIIDICSELGLTVEVSTNGRLLDSQRGQSLLSPSVRQINFSLQSFAQDEQSSEHPALHNIFELTSQAFTQRPELYINYRLWNLGGRHEGCNLSILRAIAGYFGVDIDPEYQKSRAGKAVRLLERLYLHMEPVFTWPEPAGGGAPVRAYCQAPFRQAAILADGSVVPCCLDRNGEMLLGNCFETPLEEILDSPRVRSIRGNFMRKFTTEALCRNCSYRERFSRYTRINPS